MNETFPVVANSYLYAVLGLMFAVYFLETIADTLNNTHLSLKLPEEFKGVYDEKKYDDAIAYQLTNSRFSTIQRTAMLIVTADFIIYGGFDRVDQLVRRFGWSSIPTGLAFFGVLALLQACVSLPFSVYYTFVIEDRFGFNRTTWQTFVGDIVKDAVLSVLLGAPILALIIAFFEHAGPLGWLWSWIGFTAIQLLLSFLAPAVIMPLFNKFEPLPKGALTDAIEQFARSQNFKIQGIYQMDSSKRSSKSNAFFTGFGRFRKLVLFDTLIEKQTPEELVAVVAHEIGHFKLKHIPQTIGLSIVTTGILFLVVGVVMNNPALFAAFGMHHLSAYASLLFAVFLIGPVMRLLSFLPNGLSRKFEFEADAYAARTYGKPETLVSALKKLSVDNLSNLTPHWLKVKLDYTHPPVMQRIEALRAGERA
ncbi:MAG: M48 family metallopeptidase [Oligoflexia bacterium]|nr:M48 family metallopeptidase [Oligoflexia bacterium]